MANDMAKRLLVRVRAIREALELSQETFAEHAGLKYKHYQAIEAGRKVDIRVSTLEKLAKACRLEVSELLDFTTDPIVLAEDRKEAGFQVTPRKRTGKVSRPSGEKGS